MPKPCQHDPLLRFNSASGRWVTQAPVCCVWNGVFIEAPSGFATDLATIPFPLTAISHRYGPYNRAVIIHDWIYWQLGRVADDVTMTRKEADDLMYRLMIQDGTPRWKAWAMWAAVRANPQVWNRF
jgi:hypothetical protein